MLLGVHLDGLLLGLLAGLHGWLLLGGLLLGWFLLGGLRCVGLWGCGLHGGSLHGGLEDCPLQLEDCMLQLVDDLVQGGVGAKGGLRIWRRRGALLDRGGSCSESQGLLVGLIYALVCVCCHA